MVNERKLTVRKRTKTGKPCLDAKFLQYHADRGDKACKLILEYRDYAKLLSTYITSIHDLLDPNDRIHAQYNQAGARTGRLSCSNPNLQNIPRPENDHWNIRGSFIARPGYKILCFDYGQLEMRLLAAASLQKSMLDMINSGKDIHIGNAELVFGIPYEVIKNAKKKKDNGEELTQQEKDGLVARAAVKGIGFGLLYGMGPDKLANTLGCTREEALEKIDQFLAAYPAVEEFTDECVDITRQTGYAFTLLGRGRNFTRDSLQQRHAPF